MSNVVPDVIRIPQRLKPFFERLAALNPEGVHLVETLVKYAAVGAGHLHDPEGMVQSVGEMAGRMAADRVALLTEALRTVCADAYRVPSREIEVEIGPEGMGLTLTIKGEPVYSLVPNTGDPFDDHKIMPTA